MSKEYGDGDNDYTYDGSSDYEPPQNTVGFIRRQQAETRNQHPSQYGGAMMAVDVWELLANADSDEETDFYLRNCKNVPNWLRPKR